MKVKVSPNFLNSIYVGRCAGNLSYFDQPCSMHFGHITDINIWNKALTLEEMIGWTNCRLVDKIQFIFCMN